jgi:hypothetical protein
VCALGSQISNLDRKSKFKNIWNICYLKCGLDQLVRASKRDKKVGPKDQRREEIIKKTDLKIKRKR